jgi:hypothetical protein
VPNPQSTISLRWWSDCISGLPSHRAARLACAQQRLYLCGKHGLDPFFNFLVMGNDCHKVEWGSNLQPSHSVSEEGSCEVLEELGDN